MTAENFVIQPGDVVQVVVSDPQPWGVVTISGPPGPRGPQGEPGTPGSAFEGVAWWYGDGPPQTVVGSKPGDFYMDLVNGFIYKLGD